MSIIRYGIIGTGSISRTHADALQSVRETQILAVASRSQTNAGMFAQWKGVPDAYDDYRRILERSDIDAVIVAFPNKAHAPIALEALQAGKHVLLEKPLCLTLDEADRLIAASTESGRILMYAEELCFVPRFVRLKELLDEGAVGSPYMIRQIEKHAGPHAEWFYQREQAGGGALMDMGCHSIEAIRWMLGKPAVKSVYGQIDLVLHKDKTELDDHTIVIIEFENGAVGVAEAGWAKQGGMTSTFEIFAANGLLTAESVSDTGITAFSNEGYGMLPDATRGWSKPDVDTVASHGYVAELEHFTNCIRENTVPLETAQDGKIVLEIMLAAYHSSATGRKIEFPFDPPEFEFPVDLWRPAAG